MRSRTRIFLYKDPTSDRDVTLRLGALHFDLKVDSNSVFDGSVKGVGSSEGVEVTLLLRGGGWDRCFPTQGFRSYL